MRANNINGTSDNTCKCGSWLKHWQKVSGGILPPSCRETTCSKNAEFGARIQKDSATDKGWYIVPLCKDHNSQTGKSLDIMDGTTLVSADVNQTCGKKPTDHYAASPAKFDARRHPRFKLEVDISIHSRTCGLLRGHTLDLSESGVSAMLRLEPPLGEVVDLDFALPLGAVTIDAMVRQRNAFRYGFEFVASNPMREVIRRTCRDLAVGQSLYAPTSYDHADPLQTGGLSGASCRPTWDRNVDAHSDMDAFPARDGAKLSIRVIHNLDRSSRALPSPARRSRHVTPQQGRMTAGPASASPGEVDVTPTVLK